MTQQAKAFSSPAFETVRALAASGEFAAARPRLAQALPGAPAADLAKSVTLSRQLGLVPALLAALRARAEAGANVNDLLLLGAAAMEAEAHADAATYHRLATLAEPDSAAAYSALGVSLFRCGAKEDARDALAHAITLDPEQADALRTLGSILMEDGDKVGAVALMSAAVAAAPDNPAHRVSLGWALQAQGRYEDAFLIIESALNLDPKNGAAFSALADLFWDVRDFDRALKYFKLAADAQPCAVTITPYLFNLLASDAISDEDIFAEHKRLGAVFDSPAAARKRHRNAPDPDRRLKVGLVSGDFHNHSVARFMTPIFEGLDRTQFEVTGIYNNSVEDDVTAHLRSVSEHWFTCHGESDQGAAEWIEAHGVDVLVDLSGHTNLQRLAVFGLRPAPVQATYLGYPGTTGMAAMDYKITTASIDPPGVAEALHTEKLVRLPGLMAPFAPMVDVAIGPLPCLTGDPFTFASMCQPWRVTPAVVRAWARILSARPDARLILGNVNTPTVANHIIAMFAAENIDPARILLLPRLKLTAFLELHRAVDLCLDTFPYNGGTTTTYALWMGAPVVSMEGRRSAARSGACILSEAGLDEFLVPSVDAYVEKALAWAARPHDLANLRAGMRTRLKVSNPEDQALQVRQFGDALRFMWREWCAKQI